MGAWKFWGAVAILVVLMWVLAYWLRKRRAAALRTAAEELGPKLCLMGNQSIIHRLTGFDLYSRYPSFGNTE